MPEHLQDTRDSPKACCQLPESAGSLCKTKPCSCGERLAHPAWEACHEGSGSALQHTASVLQTPASAPAARQSSPPLSHVQHVHLRSVYLSVDPEVGLFAWQSSEMAIPSAEHGAAHLAWYLAVMLIFSAFLFLYGGLAVPTPTVDPLSGGHKVSNASLSWAFSTGSLPAIADAPEDLTPGSSGSIWHGQAGVLLAGIAMLLLVATLALHLAPAGEDVTAGRAVEMPEVCVTEAPVAEGERTPTMPEEWL